MAPPVFRNFDHKIALAPQIGSSKSKIALKGMEGGSVGRCNSRQPYLISIPFDVQKGFRNGWPSIEKHWSQNRSGPSNWPKIGPKCSKFYQNRYHLIMSADISLYSRLRSTVHDEFSTWSRGRTGEIYPFYLQSNAWSDKSHIQKNVHSDFGVHACSFSR